MSTLWTPSGERPVGGGEPAGRPSQARPASPVGEPGEDQVSEEELRAQMEQMRQQLIDAPAEVVVANHCYGLFELAALHMSTQPPQLPKAKLAIDGLGAILDGLAGRLGEAEGQLRDGLASLRLAYVQLQAGADAGDAAEGGESGAS